MNVSSLITPNGISLLMDGEFHVIATDHPNYDKILNALKLKDYTNLSDLVNLTRTVANWMRNFSDVSLQDGLLSLNGKPFSEAVTDKVFKMIEAGNDAEPLVNFLRKVRQNPSYAAQNELLLFCVANKFMLHQNGNIVAYKSVRADYTDIHSGTFSNHVGAVNELPRGEVDDNRERVCSTGLHFASFEYASTWAGRAALHLMILSVNPRDVVSIPSDYNNQKGRCCRYEVVGEVKNWEPLPEKEVYFDSDFNDDDEYFCHSCGYDAEGYNDCPNCGEPQLF